MFSSSNPWIMVAGILIGLGFISGSVYWVNNMFTKNTKDVLVRFVLVIFTSLTALFIVDKTVAFRVQLLTPELSTRLFELIKTLTLMIFSYYFGTKNSENKEDENSK